MKKIISIEVENSLFYASPLKMEFSEKLNCIMGGRGTGKSTLLHFIKACFDEEAEESRATYNILKSNLGGGIITIVVEDDDGKKYKLQKGFEDEIQAYTLPGGKFIELYNLQSAILCDVYEALKIEEIGKNSYDRLDLIDKTLPGEKIRITNEIEEIQIKLDENAQLIKSEVARLNQVYNQLKNYENCEEELKKLLEEKPEDINKEEEAQFELADKNEKVRAAEKRYSKSIFSKIEAYIEEYNDLLEELNAFEATISNSDKFLNKTEISEIAETARSLVKDSIKSLTSLMNQTEGAGKKIEQVIGALQDKHSHQQNEFTLLKQKFEKHKQFYNKWNALSKKVDEKSELLKNVDTLTAKQLKVKKARQKLITDLSSKREELFKVRKQKVNELNKNFNGAIKITLAYGAITDEYEQALRNGLKGSNMRYNTLIPLIVQNFPPDKFAEIVHNKDAETLRSIVGIDVERSNAIFNALSETDEIYAIEKMHCQDLPEFMLRIDGKDEAPKKAENYRRSDELSTGQRCTTVLPIIFAVSQNPLIIDQPEDNLDNKYISETIHKIISTQKDIRQLIFITHNPNIPVLSEAEQNYFLKYEGKKGQIDVSGSIDDVKSNILNLLEGGVEAFSRRDKLYKGL